MASNDLDEYLIESLKAQGAAIDVWGVGTQLAAGGGQSALGGVYKLSAIRDAGVDVGAEWRPKIKVSEQILKTSIPGMLQARRYSSGGTFVGDMLFDPGHPPSGSPEWIDPVDPTRRKRLPPGTAFEDLLVPVWSGGKRMAETPSLAASRDWASAQLARLHPGCKRFHHPHIYPVGLEPSLHASRLALIAQARRIPSAPP
jgi:nicotinate phosphoribosyltransferase